MTRRFYCFDPDADASDWEHPNEYLSDREDEGALLDQCPECGITKEAEYDLCPDCDSALGETDA